MTDRITTLQADLAQAKTEEDVKDAYIRCLGLKRYSKNLIDIQTNEIWFEAKYERSDLLEMFAQLLYYVHNAQLNPDPEIPLPNLLCVMDKEHAAIMETEVANELLKNKKVNWPKRGSQPSKTYVNQVRSFIGTHYIEFEIQGRAKEFVDVVKDALKNKKIRRIQITPDNLRIVFDNWVEEIGNEIEGVDADDLSVLFFADVMSDGTTTVQSDLPAQLIHIGENPAFMLNNKVHQLKSFRGYRIFWATYHRPPAEEFRHYMLERRDSLLPLNLRQFKGAYYTPLNVVELAYEYLKNALGKGWQDRFLVWDPCCGVGNLEVKHSNYRNIFMSTLDKEDVDIMKSTRTCLGAEIFQYDYLNDDVKDKTKEDDSNFDYSLTNKMPQELRDFIVAKKNGTEDRKLIILMNPPYAEATNFNNIAEESQKVKAKNKTGVADTKVRDFLMPKEEYGKSTNELFIQFLARITKEIPDCYIATFSTLKYLQASNFGVFRKHWKARFLSGFIVPSGFFELKGKFPIAFAIWKIGPNYQTPKQIVFDVYDAKLKPLGMKTVTIPTGKDFLNTWIDRVPKNDQVAVPLCNALTVTRGEVRLCHWADNAVAYVYCAGNDFFHAEQITTVYSSVCGNSNGFYITEDNFEKAFLTFCARRLERPTWINNRDQFFQPNKPLPKEFINDCLIWMVFNRTQRTASADHLEWQGKNYSITCPFIPFTEQEVGAKSRFRSDFLARYIKKHKIKFSKEAQAVLDAGRDLWKQYFAGGKDEKRIRDIYHLERSDVGWFQVRKAIEERIKLNLENGFEAEYSFDTFNEAYSKLTEKLLPQAYEYGFIRDTNPALRIEKDDSPKATAEKAKD